jgi:ATP-binding cassette, subfamily B, multidrug efflux pump
MEKEASNSGEIMDFSILKRLFVFVKPYKRQFSIVIILTLSVALLAPLLPYFSQQIIDNYILPGDYEGLVTAASLLIVLLVVQGIVQYFHTYLSGWLGQHVIRDMRVKLYDHLLSLKLSFYDRTPIGRLVTRSISDIESLADIFTQGIAAIIADSLQIVMIVTLMFSYDWRLTLVSLSTLPLMILSTYIFKEKVKVSFNHVRNAVSNLNSFVQERVTGMSIVQIFGSEKVEYEQFKEINKEHRAAHLKSVMYYSIYFPVAEIIQASGIGLLVWYGASNALEGEISPGVLIAFIMYINMFFRPIRQIADRFNVLQMGIVSSSRIFKLLDNKSHIQNTGSQVMKNTKGSVTFDNVWFAYDEKDYVLKNISFEANPGDTVALVGATGAGKTSVINLLNRFYEINRGTISLDGTDVREIELQSLRSNIGLVLQDVFLFSDTIRNNITLGNPDITEEQIMKAANLVGAEKFIERLPGGLDYNVQERGATLSVGQRQLISFVRAMVYNPKIIVLDEATSSVDTETEELIQQAIERLMKGRTAIVIAHRLSTIQNADQILVMDQGEIVEKGKHQELLDHNGHYAQLHQLQYKEMA